MKKIVINRDFGGFGLCEKAFERYLELKGIEYDTSESEFSFTKETKLYWLKGRVNDNIAFLHDREIERDDPALVQVVEEMGKKANGYFADLKIVKIPDDVKWHIHEYDGLEHVAEDHRTWS